MLGETILWRPKNGFPQTPFQESRKGKSNTFRGFFIVFLGRSLGELLFGKQRAVPPKLSE